MSRCLNHDLIPRWTIRLASVALLLLAGCSTLPSPPPSPATEPAAARPAVKPAVAAKSRLPAAGSGRGGYYQDDGPGEAAPENLDAIPDAEPKVEPYALRGNKPYVVFGKTYTPLTAPLTESLPMKQRGIGSWYGKKFHGLKTSSGEPYDMYKMTAAHPTLPIPSYARVTNLRNGIQVIVRVNDRGPFHSSRIMDLSYTAALKLGYLAQGSTELEVERLLPEDIARLNDAARDMAVAGRAEAVPVSVPTAISTPVAARVTTVAFTAASASMTDSSMSIDDFLQSQSGLPLLASVLTVAPGEAIAGPASTASLPSAGFYLQFGAYGQSTNAETMRVRMMHRWPLLLPPLEVRQSGLLYRLYSGPFGTRSEALQAARMVPEAAEIKPLIVER